MALYVKKNTKGSFASVIWLVAAWQACSYAGIFPPVKVPSPVEVMNGVGELWNTGMPPGNPLLPHILYSLMRVGCGYGAAVLVGVPLGLAVGWSPAMHRLCDTPLELLRPVPPMAWIPISVLWFGIGTSSAAFIIFLGAVFPIVLNTVAGVRAIDPIILDAAKTLNAGRRTLFFKVLVPATIPAIFTGLRVGIGIGWMTLVAAEFTGVREGYGLGYMIMTARDIQRPDLILAGMLVIGLIGYGVDRALRALQSRVVAWQ